MIIKIDTREDNLLATMNLLFKDQIHDIQVENLLVGDVILLNDESEEKIIFERKTLYDLASSIKDGRYKEQSFRLNNCDMHNHNIIYIIEGDLAGYKDQKGRLDKKSLVSAMITLQYFKGFSVLRTKSINETCAFIISYANKLGKESKKQSFYMGGSEKINSVDYSEVACSREKKSNITKDNINEIMLSNIPRISIKTAKCILEHFKTIKNLISELEKDENCLDNIKMKNDKGVERKINKNSIENIKKYLME